MSIFLLVTLLAANLAMIAGTMLFKRRPWSRQIDPLQRCHLSEVVRDTLLAYGAHLRGDDIKVVSVVVGDVELECRSAQIRQVLLNLLTNARDAVQAREERWIRVEARDLGDQVELSVANSGPALCPSLRRHVFKPLGLSLSRAIAESHGGQLNLCSSSENTCFQMRLPKRRVQTAG